MFFVLPSSAFCSCIRFFKNGPIPASFSVYFRLLYTTQIKNKVIKVLIVCLGLELGAAGWKAQTNPLSYGGTPIGVFVQFLHMFLVYFLSIYSSLFVHIKVYFEGVQLVPTTFLLICKIVHFSSFVAFIFCPCKLWSYLNCQFVNVALILKHLFSSFLV